MSRPAVAFALVLLLTLLPRGLHPALRTRAAADTAATASPAAPAGGGQASRTPRRDRAAPVRASAPRPSLELSPAPGLASGSGAVAVSAGPASFGSHLLARSLSGSWGEPPADVTYHAHDSGIGLWGRLGDVSLYAGGFRLELTPMERMLRDWTARLPRLVPTDAPDIGGFAGVDLAAGDGVSLGAEYRWFGDQAIGLVLRKSF